MFAVFLSNQLKLKQQPQLVKYLQKRKETVLNKTASTFLQPSENLSDRHVHVLFSSALSGTVPSEALSVVFISSCHSHSQLFTVAGGWDDEARSSDKRRFVMTKLAYKQYTNNIAVFSA